MKEGHMYFMHVRDGKKAITFAVQRKDDWVQFSYSLCSPRDHFNKGIGRVIATGRLAKGKRVSGFKLEHESAFKLTVDSKLVDIMKAVESNFWAAVESRQDWIHGVSWLKKWSSRRSNGHNGSNGKVIKSIKITGKDFNVDMEIAGA